MVYPLNERGCTIAWMEILAAPMSNAHFFGLGELIL